MHLQGCIRECPCTLALAGREQGAEEGVKNKTLSPLLRATWSRNAVVVLIPGVYAHQNAPLFEGFRVHGT